MKIAIVAHSVFGVSEPYKGGLEKFIHKLANKLVEYGLDVTLFCNSKTEEGLYKKIAFTDFDYKFDNQFDSLNKDYKELINYLSTNKEFELIHNNSLNNNMMQLSKGGIPVLTTIHIPAMGEFKDAVFKNIVNHNNYINIVSASCLKSWKGIKSCRVIHNGIDVDLWDSSCDNRQGAIWFGRVCPEKGVERSIQAAISASMPITIAGIINDQDYFNYLKNKYKHRFNYIGLCDHKKLNNLIKSSEVFIKAPVWEEPFGYVYLESLACGTPIVTYNSFIANEILNSKVASITNTNIKSLGLGAIRSSKLSSNDCVEHVRNNFSLDKTVKEYIKLYKDICSK